MTTKEWTIGDSARLYNIKGWGLNYFRINEKGNLCFHPRRLSKRVIDIKEVVDDIVARGIQLPAMIRFQDILRDRVGILNRAFRRAIEEHHYQGKYMGVYPIKVNQLREVVEEVLDAGKPYRVGLEAGSKAELMAVLAMNNPDCLTVVNGYKDESVMRLACLGAKLERKIFVVIEKLTELDTLLPVCEEMGVRPLIGLRAKLHSEGTGKWKDSAGTKAKFGLSIPEILAAVEILRANNMQDNLKLIHFHIGSQITEITAVQSAVKEAARIFAKLCKMGVPLEYLDCGGGIGVDYEGTNSSNDHSINYTLEEYARDVVYSIQEVCNQEKVAEPNIITESGRAITAYHAMLISNVFGIIQPGSASAVFKGRGDGNRVVNEMRELLGTLSPETLAENYHDGLQRLEESNSLFKLGYMELEDKAEVEMLFWRLCLEIQKLLPADTTDIPEALKKMVKNLEPQYQVNFSVFQSLPDVWAIDHIFPILPIHRLEEEPKRTASLVDITCDSDGKIHNFVYGGQQRDTMPIHSLDENPYYLGIFLMGAYQSTMGDIHNLFGRVNEVHVFEDEEEPSGYYIEEVINGERIGEVLTEIQYSEYELVRMIKTAIDARVKAGGIKPREGVELLNMYEAMMQEYTYLDRGSRRPVGGPEAGPAPLAAAPAAPAAEPAAAPAAPTNPPLDAAASPAETQV
ncbi:MAG: arginine decarboxylase [Elusimicrobia bacterium GWA2_69_24]|nr:MAG: arginine decarboxylase [Elusimicrobia bacterium GWA2_69_24]